MPTVLEVSVPKLVSSTGMKKQSGTRTEEEMKRT